MLIRSVLIKAVVWMALWYSHMTASEPIWEYFKQKFISQDGRVIDTQNQQISHSEGQGYGMLLAVKYDDLSMFKKLWQWSQNNLQIREDKLFAWKFGENESGLWKVLDDNNATDGDVLIAWALVAAGKRWHTYSYITQAKVIQADIIQKTLIDYRERLFLLPAAYGFTHGNRIRLNPSYLVFPAYQALANQFSGPWQRLIEDGQWLVEASLHSELDLPSDWVTVNTQTGRVHNDANFSAEAIRVWLYSALVKNAFNQVYPGFRYWQKFYNDSGHYPDRFDSSKLKFEGYGMPGYWAVSARVLMEQGQVKQAKTIWRMAKEKLLREQKNYYSTALYLLSLPINLSIDGYTNPTNKVSTISREGGL